VKPNCLRSSSGTKAYRRARVTDFLAEVEQENHAIGISLPGARAFEPNPRVRFRQCFAVACNLALAIAGAIPSLDGESSPSFAQAGKQLLNLAFICCRWPMPNPAAHHSRKESVRRATAITILECVEGRRLEDQGGLWLPLICSVNDSLSLCPAELPCSW